MAGGLIRDPKKLNIFSPEQVQEIVDKTLPKDVKAGEKVLVGTVDQNGAQVVAGFQYSWLRGTWSLQAVARHEWGGDNSVGGKVLVRWK